MSRALAPLRGNLDFMPSPVEDRPGLLIRDPLGYAEQVLILPPPLVRALMFFDGEHSEGDLRELLVRLTGELEVGDLLEHLVRTLADGGFLMNDELERRREVREQAFASAPVRAPSHAGSAYPEEPGALTEAVAGWMNGAATQTVGSEELLAIAAPHVSPEGGHRCYSAAYGALGDELAGRTFLILGTSHFGAPHRFGLTRKPFATPWGEAATDAALVARLLERGGPAVSAEDYCHAVEHSIEFQVVFLQHRFGPGVRIVPVLCGPFDTEAEQPEGDPGVARFIDALGELIASEGPRLVTVLGIDLAHIGSRYGDAQPARAGEGPLALVAERDRERLEAVTSGDAGALWQSVRGGDALRWCGLSPLYTFLRAAPGSRGETRRYEQWNIDDDSVVSFAALRFARPS